jgi:hypothetical protein
VQLPGFPPPPVPYLGFGIITYDGKGNASGSFTTNTDGLTIPATFAGTYGVNADCTYTDQLTTSVRLSGADAGVITGMGISREVHYMSTSPGFVSLGTIDKQGPHEREDGWNPLDADREEDNP